MIAKPPAVPVSEFAIFRKDKIPLCIQYILYIDIRVRLLENYIVEQNIKY